MLKLPSLPQSLPPLNFRLSPSDLKSKINQNTLRSFQARHWMNKRGKRLEFTGKKRAILKKMFDDLDSDGSKLVSVEELYEPLLSLGIMENKKQVEALIASLGAETSGVIEFQQFLKLFDSTKPLKIYELETLNISNTLQRHKNHGLPFTLSAISTRRKLMLKAFWGQTKKERLLGNKVINAFCNEIESPSLGPSKKERLQEQRNLKYNRVNNRIKRYAKNRGQSLDSGNRINQTLDNLFLMLNEY